jgi:hypothetical protein
MGVTVSSTGNSWPLRRRAMISSCLFKRGPLAALQQVMQSSLMRGAMLLGNDRLRQSPANSFDP